MLLERLDEYLDGALDAAGRQEVEALVASDAAAARRLAALKSQRALRTAAYESYMPTRHEASALAVQMLSAAYDAPVGRVGYWVRRGAAVAAALVIVAGTFAVGRVTATPQEREVVVTRVVYNVVYTDIGGDQRMQEFATETDRDSFVSDLEKRGITGIAVADLMIPGHL